MVSVFVNKAIILRKVVILAAKLAETGFYFSFNVMMAT